CEQSLLGTQRTHHADHQGCTRKQRRAKGGQRAVMLDVDPVWAYIQALWPGTFVLDHMDPHGLAIHYNPMRQAIRKARQAAIARLQGPVRSLAGEHSADPPGSRHRYSEAGQRQIESVHQLDSMAAKV